ncbi:PAS domain S-box-containing protein [Mucilaginibacter auburnensis]|uniref:histidine kinase n=2 Tax=Mucilaginibacter auburnensis TaxID=1457233 RepID=A0A2H9VNX6_9SPHI|nr:PAS domain S-box-containing protein [Mucilaginibacter auburnensis]
MLLDILSKSKDATAVYDSADLHIRFVNQSMLALWGKNFSVKGKTIEDALPELHDQPFFDILKKIWQTGETYSATNTPASLMIDGELKTSFFDFEYRAILNEEGQTYAILHTSADVTQRVEAFKQVQEKQEHEELLHLKMTVANKNLSTANRELQTYNDSISRLNILLQESETDFKRLVQQAPVAILVFRGADMVIDIANHAMLEILNKDTSIIGKPLLQGLPEIEGATAVDMLFEVFNTGKALDGNEAPVPMMRDGVLETRYFNFSYRPLRDETGVVGVMDIAVDVTEQVLARKNLEDIIAEKTELAKTLRSSETRLQGILDTMAEGVGIIDANGQMVYANPMAQRILGLSEDEIKKRTYGDARWQNLRLDGSPLPDEEHPMAIMMRTGLASYDQEIAVQPPVGERMYISINSAPIFDERGTLTGGIGTFMDVTNRRKMMIQKDDFISVASHELKTPVTALKAALQLLERMKKDVNPNKFEKLLSQANKSLNKLSDLINSLLNSNRISQGRFPIHKTKFSIAELINECCQHVRTVGEHDIIFTGDLNLQITADEQLLDQVIVNLVNNAVKYAPKSREIKISVEELPNQVKVSVTDSGPGIPADKVKHIFERYYQADSDNRQFSGLGLGLYISAEIIHKHGGEIGVDSEPGNGSTFWFTLPLGE